MQRRKFAREFRLEPVGLVRERGVSVAQAARDPDVHENVLRKWVREFGADPGQSFPGNGQMRPEQLEIERLRREVAKLKAERDILKNGRLLREGLDMRLVFIARRRTAGGIDVRGAQRFLGGVSRSGFHAWLTKAPSQRVRDREHMGIKVRAATLAAIALMARAGSGTICWQTARRAACIGSSG